MNYLMNIFCCVLSSAHFLTHTNRTRLIIIRMYISFIYRTKNQEECRNIFYFIYGAGGNSLLMMNSITAKILVVKKCVTIITTSEFIFRCNKIIHSRGYARATSFPDFFQNPVFRKEEQALLAKNNELHKMALVPVKPPAAYETSSVYHDPLVNKVINHIMEKGNKQLARSLLEKSFENIKRIQIERYHLAVSPEQKAKIELNPKEILHRAINNAKPLLMLSPIKRGGITYQVPGPITERRSLFMAIKWLLEATYEKERTVHFPQQFAWELLDAANNTGKVIKRKQDLHRQCEANRAYAHYRWQ